MKNYEPGGSPNAVWHYATVTRAKREQLNGRRTFVFDGDNVRHGLCADLGFSVQERAENLRRIGEMAKLFVEAGVISLAAFISPYRAERKRIRTMFVPEDFYEIHCDCPLEVCEARDVKGVYKRARAGEIPEFTGITAPYEPPKHPDLRVSTGSDSLEDCVKQVMEFAARVMPRP